MSEGKSKFTTWVTRSMSTPRPTTSVATRARRRPSRKARSVASRWSCFRAPCMTPQRSRPKCSATRTPRSSAALRVPTKISALPGVLPSPRPRASSKCLNNIGSFCSKLLYLHCEDSTTSTIWWISRGGSVTPEWPGSSKRLPPCASEPSSPSSGFAETREKVWLLLQRRCAACSTSTGHVAEKKSICRSLRIASEIAVTSSSKP
mmetsp:Transcript_115875/g.324070  ORF Transcript_115875/g.324070 Transcript_115875/m.324070 type:complete len:205 (+) Transcript_115875:436-1050(+)